MVSFPNVYPLEVGKLWACLKLFNGLVTCPLTVSILRLILKLPVMLFISVEKMSPSSVILSPLANLYLPLSLQTLG